MEEPRDIPSPAQPEDVSGKAVAALICSVLGLAHACPCVGPALGIALGYAEKSSVGKAAVALGGIGLALNLLEGLVILVNVILFDWFG